MTDLLGDVRDYYGRKLAEHGPTARGVDWNSAESQALRFEQLLAVVDCQPASLIDFGCGYGALVDHLRQRQMPLTYVGYDIAPEMIAAGRRLHPLERFTPDLASLTPADYCVASGIFNVKLAAATAAWREHIARTLEQLDALSRRGFSANFLTSYSDRERMRDDLYYADPCDLFDLCKRRFSRRVALLHDYELWEFTLIVRKG